MSERFKSLKSLCFAVLCLSCITPTDLDPGEKPRVIVNCLLTYPDARQELSLAYSTPNSKKPGKPIDSGRISLFDDTAGRLVGQFYSLGSGKWALDYTVVSEHEYRLEIEIEGEESISATTKVPCVGTIRFVPYAPIMSNLPEDMLSNTAVFYEASTLYGTKDLGETPLWVYILNYSEEQGTHSLGKYIAVNDEDSYVDRFNPAAGEVPWHTRWRRCVFCLEESRQYQFKYLRFETAPCGEMNSVWIDGDIRNSVCSFEDYSAVVSLEKENRYYITRPCSIPLKDRGFIVFMSVSDDYDKYLKESLIRRMKEEGEDMTVLYERCKIYSNIKNGDGILGAKVTYYMPWNEPSNPELL